MDVDIQKTDNDNYRVWVKCKCSCGNKKSIRFDHLKDGHTQSCGCITSKNEAKIRRLLIDNNVKFKTQLWFDDLRNPITNSPLKFDFSIFDKDNHLALFIEFDGQQHFSGFRFSHDPKKNRKKFETLQKCDKLKNKYCQNNGFSLLRIPYTYENEVEKLVIDALKEKGVI